MLTGGMKSSRGRPRRTRRGGGTDGETRKACGKLRPSISKWSFIQGEINISDDKEET